LSRLILRDARNGALLRMRKKRKVLILRDAAKTPLLRMR
jgi:hypothetical protein